MIDLFNFNDPVGLFFGGLKGLYLVGGGVYVVFAVVVVAQIRSMTQTLNGALELPMKLIGYVHLAVSLGALILAFVLL